MARAGRTEPDSVSIWLKLSAEDAARMTQVLTRPEFAGWTRAEWCLEMIQTALGYYTRPRPAAGADGERAPTEEPAPDEPAEAGGAGGGRGARGGARACRSPSRALRSRLPRRRSRSSPRNRRPTNRNGSSTSRKPVADEPGSPAQADCPHPADARDYQSGTCAACGAILWD